MKFTSRMSKSSSGRNSMTKELSSSDVVKAVDTSMDNSEGTRDALKSLFGSQASLLGHDDPAFDESSTVVEIDESTIVVGKVKKPTRSSKVGISLRKSKELNSIIIAAVAEGGLFASSELSVGQKILSINGIPCPNDPVEAARLIAQADDELAIEAGNIKEEKDHSGIFIDDEDDDANEDALLPTEETIDFPVEEVADIITGPDTGIEVSRSEPEEEVEAVEENVDEIKSIEIPPKETCEKELSISEPNEEIEAVEENADEIKSREIPSEENCEKELPVNNISEEATMNYLWGLSVAVGTVLVGAGYAFTWASGSKRTSV